MLERLRIAVVGGGISGLAAAHRLRELSAQQGLEAEVILLEASERLGGVINTKRQNDLLLETGPDSFITQKPWALDLCKRLGISDEVMPTNQQFRRSYIAQGNHIHPLPEGFLMMAPSKWWPFITSPLISWPGKLRMACDLFLPAAPHKSDESLASFVRRRLGQEALDKIAQPMVGGVYTADPEKLSLLATMPRFMEMEQKYGSVIRGLRSESQSTKQDSGARYSMFVTMEHGMQSLVEALSKRLLPQHIHLQTPVQSINRTVSGWTVLLHDGGKLNAHAVILALPAHQASKLMSGMDSRLADDLSQIEYASSAVLNLVYNRRDIPDGLEGFGFVVPAVEGRFSLACTFSSVKFAKRSPADQVILRVFAGGAMQNRICELSDAELIEHAQVDLKHYLGIKTSPRSALVSRHVASMPQYHLGHIARVKRIEARLQQIPGLYLAGNAYCGVGIPDCINSGQQAAEMLIGKLPRSQELAKQR